MSEEFMSMPGRQWDEFVEESGRRSDRLDRALALLREVEWAGDRDGDPSCIYCMGYMNEGTMFGHGYGCKLKALLEESDD